MKKTTKLLLAVLVVAVLCLSLTACETHEHTYGDWTLTTAPTLTTEGTATHKCTDCNEIESVTVPALTDTTVWTATPNPAPTHTTAGKTDYTSVYGKVTIDVDALGDAHAFDQKVVDAKYLKSAATCSSPAVYYYSCVCGEKGTETFTDGEALAHTYAFGGWATEPTLTAGGVATLECSVCHATSTENVAALSDATVWSKVDDKHVAATCIAEGKDVYANATYGEVEVTLAKLSENGQHHYSFKEWTTEPTLTAGGVATLECGICHGTTTENVAAFSDATVWTHTHTDATYSTSEKDVYTATLFGQDFTYTISGSKKDAPYLGKSYVGMRGTFSSSYIGSEGLTLAIGADGTAKDTFVHKDGESYGSMMGSYVYSNGKFAFEILDDSGKVKVTLTWTETDEDYGMESNNKSEEHWGVVSADGKYILINGNSGLDKDLGSYYLFVEESSVDAYLTSGPIASGTAKLDAFTVNGTEHVVYLEKSAVWFDVTLNGEDGAKISVSDIASQSKFTVITADGKVGFAKSDSSFFKTDELEGTYTSADGKTITLDGLGNITANLDSESNGSYTINSDGTLDVLLDSATKYLLVTLGEGNTFTYTQPVAEVTFVTNGGTLEGITDNKTSYNIKIANVLPVPAYGEAYKFEGWYYDEACTNAVGDSITLADTGAITLYAKVTAKAIVKFVDLLDGEETSHYLAVGDKLLANAPAYTYETAKDGKLFRGWYVLVDGSRLIITEKTAITDADSGTTIEIHANWADIVTITKVLGNGQSDETVTAAAGDVVELDGVGTLYKNGKLLVGWYDNAELSGEAIASLTVNSDTSVYAKWEDAESYVIDNEVSGARDWKYDEATDIWTSNNKDSHSTSAIFILTVREDAKVTFLYGASSEGGKWDFLAIYRVVNGVETQIYTDGGYDGDKKENIIFQNGSVELKAGESLKFVYIKDSSTSHGLDQAQIKNLLVIGASHKHTYDKQIVADAYLATGATCKAAATYYYSCICGEYGEETFSHGDKAAHNYVDGVCTGCGKVQPTYSLTAITNNDANENKALSVKDGETIDLVELAGTKSGYNFEGWYLDCEYTQAFDGTLTDDTTIYAKWSPAASLAGSTYEGRYYNSQNDYEEDGTKTPNTNLKVIFTDSTTGVLYDGPTMYFFNFTYVVNVDKVVMTVESAVSKDYVGKTIIANYDKTAGTLSFTKEGTFSSNAYQFCTEKAIAKLTSGGSSSGSTHTCVFSQKTISADNLAVAAADCKHHPAYYYSCECGKHGSETFEDEATFGAHKYVDGVCTGCGAAAPAEKVEVTIDLADGSEATTKEIVKGTTLTLETPARSGYKFLGWFIGEEAFLSGETTIDSDVTITAKWQAEPQSTGVYKGWNMYGDKSSGAAGSLTAKDVITVNADGTYSYDSKTGTLTAEQAQIVDGSMVLNGTYYYFNKEIGAMWRKYNGGKADGVGIDTDIGFLADTVTKVEYCGNNTYGSSYVALLWITYANGTTKTAFLYNNMIVANVTFPEGKTYQNALKSDIVISKDGQAIAKLSGNKVLSSDGLQGDYTGEATLNINGFGDFTVGEISGTYTVAAEGAGYTLLAKTKTAAYKITLSGSSYTMEAYNVVASFDFGTLAELAGSFDEQIIPYGVSTKLNDAPAIEGYKFRGWYENADFTGSAKTNVTLTENKTYYAKYDAIVTVTFDYSGYEYEEGKTTTVVNTLAVGDTLGNTIPSIASDVRYDDKAFVGWFTKNGEEWGTQATSTTKLTETVTYYAKWVDAHAMYGIYHGVEIYGSSTTAIGGTNSGGFDRTYKVDILGVMSGEDSGTITDYNADTGYFMVGSHFGWYDAVNGIMVYSDGTSTNGLTADFHIAIKGATEVVANTKGCWWNNGYTKLVTLTITKDKTYDVNVIVMNNKLYYNVTWTSTAGTFTDKDAYNAANLTILNADGEEIAKFEQVGSTGLQLNDGKTGTYSGEYGDVVVNGFGVVTIGETSTSYTLDGNQITFIINNAMRTIALENGTYTKVLDGYEGEYTLPDGSTVTLDGYGGAGDGKTYIVEKKNVTIFVDGVGTKYKADFATKELSVQTVSFAAKTYRKDTYSYIKFDDTEDISGTFYFEDDSYQSYVKFKNATFEDNELTLTISSGDKNYTKGGIVVFTYDNGNLVLKSKAGIETDYCHVGDIFKL